MTTEDIEAGVTTTPAPRAEEPRPEPHPREDHRREERPREEIHAPAPAAEEPVLRPATPIAPPAAPRSHVEFHAVSEHGEAQEEALRPQRRRRHGQEQEAASQQGPLELVETLAQAVPAAEAIDEGLPRRTKPRRRRGAPAVAEPLQLVETEGEPAPGDNAPAP